MKAVLFSQVGSTLKRSAAGSSSANAAGAARSAG